MKKENQLAPLIKLCAQNRGVKSDVLRRFLIKGGGANWAQMSEWLHPDPEKRRTPRAAKMKMLSEIQKEVCK